MNPYQPPGMPGSGYAPPPAAPQGQPPVYVAPHTPPPAYQQAGGPAGYAPPPQGHPSAYAPPAAPPPGYQAPQGPPAAASRGLYGQRAVSLFGAGAAKVGMDRQPRIPLGEHVLEFVSVECKDRRNDRNYIALFLIVASNRPELEGKHCVFYQSLQKLDVALGQIKGLNLPLLGFERADPRFGDGGDPGAILWLDQCINEAIEEDPATGAGRATYGGTWENWGTGNARLVAPGPKSHVGTRIRCVATPSKAKPADKIDVFGDQFYGKPSFFVLA